MKNYALAILIAFVTLSMHSQDSTDKKVGVMKGDVIEIGNPSDAKYKYIKLPRANFVVSRNGVKNYKAALGNKVVVTEVETIHNGETRIIVRRKDHKRFFNTVPTITINLEKALEVNEIKLL